MEGPGARGLVLNREFLMGPLLERFGGQPVAPYSELPAPATTTPTSLNAAAPLAEAQSRAARARQTKASVPAKNDKMRLLIYAQLIRQLQAQAEQQQAVPQYTVPSGERSMV